MRKRYYSPNASLNENFIMLGLTRKWPLPAARQSFEHFLAKSANT